MCEAVSVCVKVFLCVYIWGSVEGWCVCVFDLVGVSVTVCVCEHLVLSVILCVCM